MESQRHLLKEKVAKKRRNECSGQVQEKFTRLEPGGYAPDNPLSRRGLGRR